MKYERRTATKSKKRAKFSALCYPSRVTTCDIIKNSSFPISYTYFVIELFKHSYQLSDMYRYMYNIFKNKKRKKTRNENEDKISKSLVHSVFLHFI